MEFYDQANPKAIVKANLPRNHGSLISNPKVGILPLPFETGRWKDTPIESRLCSVCDKCLLENEYHFLLHCNAYRETKTEFFQELLDETGLEVKGTEAEMVDNTMIA